VILNKLLNLSYTLYFYFGCRSQTPTINTQITLKYLFSVFSSARWSNPRSVQSFSSTVRSVRRSVYLSKRLLCL